MPASRFLKHTGRNWPNPVCSFYLPVSTSRDDPVHMHPCDTDPHMKWTCLSPPTIPPQAPSHFSFLFCRLRWLILKTQFCVWNMAHYFVFLQMLFPSAHFSTFIQIQQSLPLICSPSLNWALSLSHAITQFLSCTHPLSQISLICIHFNAPLPCCTFFVYVSMNFACALRTLQKKRRKIEEMMVLFAYDIVVIYIYIYIYIHVYEYIHIYTYIYAYKYIYMYIYTYI